MSALTIRKVTEEIKDLPTLPAVVMELLNTLDNDDIDVHVLAEKVTHDSALTAKTLRLANSAYYATMIKVTTVQQAISLLGLNTVRQIVTSAALSGCFPENNCKGFDHKAFWRHSNAVAIAAKILAKRTNVNVDVAFTAGLLHDIGALVLVTQYASLYESVLRYRDEHDVTQFEAEHLVLGINHTEVGEALAEQWNFSDVMRKAIAGHHTPDISGMGFLASIIHVADGIAHALGVTTTPDHAVPEVSALSWESLQLDQASFDQIMTEAQAAFDKLSEDTEL